MVQQRQFKQRRAEATYHALLEAAERVFAKRGFESTQTPDIAAEAGVSTGAFYRYFRDKRQVFVQVVANHLRQWHKDVMAELAPDRFVGRLGTDRRRAIDLVIDVLFDRVRRDASLERAWISLSLSDPEITRLLAEHEAEGVAALAQLIRIIVPRSVVPDPHASARVIAIAAFEVAADRAGLRPRVGTPGDDAAIKAALREMLYRYLFPADEKRTRRAPSSRRSG